MDAGDWPTATGVAVAIVALGVSWLSLRAAEKQAKVAVRAFDEANEKEQQRLERRQKALRAAFIPVADETAEWARDIAAALLNTPTSDAGDILNITAPSFAAEYTQAFISVIEAGENQAVSMRLAKILSTTQTLSARIKGVNQRRLHSLNASERALYLKDAAVVHAQALSVLLWADGREQTVSALTWDEVRQSVRSLDIRGGAQTAVLNLINRFSPSRDPEDFGGSQRG
ncbi:hypothetical protein J2800_000970 [Caulobacter rhizosphaerae]|uniref:Uncharacterized protein n=1 Tax=Caulobacter rhizosphaerae TaxID=2010972 RepID=A0ABU1MVM3_9CAUL|nr:hypothetical protein [Caulobacter rhizosphaerae]MDR6530234.1 hypothetical protein [Caulobacter rhizosphaerae]